MYLKQLVSFKTNLHLHNPHLNIKGVTTDSRKVKKDFLFAALSGSKTDGNLYIHDALNRGASAIITRPQSDIEIPPHIEKIEDPNPHKLFSQIAAYFYNERPEFIVGITGTNGKTSTADFIRQLWAHKHIESGSVGTLGVITNHHYEYGSLTTPSPEDLYKILQDLKLQNITHVALEASSHGLHQYRLDGLLFKAAGFTNLTRDHLDYHKDMASYQEAKARLFKDLLEENAPAVLNIDDPAFDYFKNICQKNKRTVITYGKHATDIQLIDQKLTAQGQQLSLKIFDQKIDTFFPVAGNFQIYNLLCALGLVIGTGTKVADALSAIPTLKSVPGRIELVGQLNNQASIYIDYAHTPDALETILKALRPHTDKQLIVVFGCGGNRDRGKRPQMGSIADRLADKVIVTDDNPRHENPNHIRKEILAACKKGIEIANREQAIYKAINMLHSQDILVIAGKGHETGQIVGNTVHPFDDKVIANQAILEKNKGNINVT
ncbi:MAG: UDP-N-acetylmuramoyl-L-alanyl-D-glutamate--2,6-diaminopimelate ligase [Alphaproteobacteria bacterium]|nr:UDP-N-acetylmuramoyl-L-alanyl-D-glutamate--2,6-diaminopimelate ligase [Alphaproteobacteria bacterium]